MKQNTYGHLLVTPVTGSTVTGLYAADGSTNVYDASAASGYVGAYHPCGALNVYLVTSPSTPVGARAANGAMNIINGDTNKGLQHSSGAINVSGFTVTPPPAFTPTYYILGF